MPSAAQFPFTDSGYVGFDYISPFIALTNERANFSISGFRIEASKEPIGFKAHYLIDNNTDKMVLEPTEIYNETDQVFGARHRNSPLVY